jgi:hypothetical protein
MKHLMVWWGAFHPPKRLARASREFENTCGNVTGGATANPFRLPPLRSSRDQQDHRMSHGLPVESLNVPRITGAQHMTGDIQMLNKKTVIALSVAAMAASSIALPAAAANMDKPVQLASCNPCSAKKGCNPCAAKKGCNPCAAKTGCNPCAAKKGCNPCAAKKGCNPCAAKK